MFREALDLWWKKIPPTHPCLILMKNRKDNASEKRKIKLWEKLWNMTTLSLLHWLSQLGWRANCECGKLVPPKDLGSIVHPDIIHWKYWHYSMTNMCLHFFFQEKNTHSLRILEDTLIFLKLMVNEHVSMNLVLLNINFNPTNFETWQNIACFKDYYHMQ